MTKITIYKKDAIGLIAAKRPKLQSEVDEHKAAYAVLSESIEADQDAITELQQAQSRLRPSYWGTNPEWDRLESMISDIRNSMSADRAKLLFQFPHRGLHLELQELDELDVAIRAHILDTIELSIEDYGKIA